MARSFYAFARAGSPSRFMFMPLSNLLSFNELWQESLTIGGPALLFRLRSENGPPKQVSGDDVVEWCCGLFDSTTRWRVAWSAGRCLLQSIRTPALAQACWNAIQTVTGKHQAAMSMMERHQLGQNIRAVVDEINKGSSMQIAYECEVAQMMMRLCFADSDYEAQGLLPYRSIHAANTLPADMPDGKLRSASVDMLFASLVLTESFSRLCERAPEWNFAPMPLLRQPTQASAPPESDESLGDEPPEDDEP